MVGVLNQRANGPLRVLLADDHEIIRLGVASALKVQLECEICAQASDGREALKLVESTHPDVAVVDLGLPGLNGFDLTEQIRRYFKDTEVVVLSGDDSIDAARLALEAGARAFILKVDAVQHLAGAVKSAAQHRFYLTPHSHSALQVAKVPSPKRSPTRTSKNLTSRERDVIQLLAEGRSNKEAAAILGLSVKTVKTHRAATMRKLKLARPSDLIRYAIRSKIIQA
jgi:DNA-binding NarL/FixJ family response regulator